MFRVLRHCYKIVWCCNGVMDFCTAKFSFRRVLKNHNLMRAIYAGQEACPPGNFRCEMVIVLYPKMASHQEKFY